MSEMTINVNLGAQGTDTAVAGFSGAASPLPDATVGATVASSDEQAPAPDPTIGAATTAGDVVGAPGPDGITASGGLASADSSDGPEPMSLEDLGVLAGEESDGG